MGDLKKTQQRFTVIAVFLGVIVVALAGYLLWPGSSVTAQALIKAKLQKEHNELETRLNGWKASNPEQIRAQIKAFYGREIPSRRSQIDERLDKLSLAAGLSAQSIRYGTETDKNDLPGIQRIKVDTTVTGDYAKLAHFINSLEQDSLFFIIEKISLTGRDESGGGKDVSLQITVNTFLKSTA